MARHSKHSNDRSFYSYKERQEAGFAGNRKEILGSDCFLPFGFCCLSLKPPKDPVATPDGFIFDREHILEYLLTQKLELQSKAKKFEAQEQKKARKVQAELAQEEVQKIVDFQEVDQGLLSQDLRHSRAIDKKEAENKLKAIATGNLGISGAGGEDQRPEKRLRTGELLVIDKQTQRQKSFWAKECTPNSAPTELAKVDTTVRCPMSQKKLRIKDLVPLKFEVTDQKILDKGGDKGVYCCAVSKHPIVHQKVVLLKPSGQVVLESVLKDCVLKDMVCPISSKPLVKDDILKLQAGGTGFSGHNDIEAKVFGHIRSREQDDAKRGGHLPKGGYCGL